MVNLGDTAGGFETIPIITTQYGISGKFGREVVGTMKLFWYFLLHQIHLSKYYYTYK